MWEARVGLLTIGVNLPMVNQGAGKYSAIDLKKLPTFTIHNERAHEIVEFFNNKSHDNGGRQKIKNLFNSLFKLYIAKKMTMPKPKILNKLSTKVTMCIFINKRSTKQKQAISPDQTYKLESQA